MEINMPSSNDQETVREYEVLELTSRETEAFLAALENPPRLSPKLERAIRDHAKHVDMKW